MDFVWPDFPFIGIYLSGISALDQNMGEFVGDFPALPDLPTALVLADDLNLYHAIIRMEGKPGRAETLPGPFLQLNDLNLVLLKQEVNWICTWPDRVRR